MNKTAIIVAAGAGKRIGTEIPKQFLLIHNKPVLYYAINAFFNTYNDIQIILVLAEEYLSLGQEIVDAYFDKEKIKITVGGATRFESVKKGLALVLEEGIVFVHDAARCLVSKDLIARCYEKATETGTAIPVVKCSDSLRMVTADGDSEIIDREKMFLVQTPQVFHSGILLPAFNIDYKEYFTDEASVIEAFGVKVSLLEGEKNNIKITHPLDIKIAVELLREEKIMA